MRRFVPLRYRANGGITGFFGQSSGWLADRIDTLTAFLVLRVGIGIGIGGMVLPLVPAVAHLRRRGR